MKHENCQWFELTIGDLLTLEYGKGLSQSKRKAGQYPVIGSGGIVGYNDEPLVKGPGIVVGRKGSIGTVYYEKSDFFPIDTVFYARLRSPEYDIKFVYYLLLTLNLSTLNSDAAVPGLNRHLAHRQKCKIPPLPTQRKIAAILSAYDDLIENNTRRIRILEEMVQMIYREWFVNFRFPGHEKVKMVESELGLIPEGWEVKPIGEVVETLGGGTPSTKNPEYWEGGDVTWFIPSDLTKSGNMFISDSEKKITRLGLEKSSARVFPAYSVMMTSRATIGVVAINTKQACTNQGFITCIPNERVSAHQIYFWIKDNLEKITSIASGATYKEINRTEFRSLSITVPDIQTTRRFIELTEPIGTQIENLLNKNANLHRTRDLLLPKLISGEVDIDTEGLEQ
jgi:type I restriction enzyme S subunit